MQVPNLILVVKVEAQARSGRGSGVGRVRPSANQTESNPHSSTLLQRVVLCELSMGGYIALRAIERNPERCRALVLCDTTSNADSNETKLRRAASIKSIKSAGVKPYGDEFLKAVLTSQTFAQRTDVVEAVRGMIQTNTSIGMCGALLAMVLRAPKKAPSQ